MQKKGKITMFQTVLLLLIMTYSATMRLVTKFSVYYAKQAAWLCSIVSIVCISIIYYIIYVFVNKYPGKSIPYIIYKICGRVIGKIIIFIYIIWILILLSIYVRYVGERLVSSIYTSSNIDIFFIIFLGLIAIVLRKDIVILARMNTVLCVLLLIHFFFLQSLLSNNINIDLFTPISSLDIVPIIKGSFAFVGIEIYVFYFFMTSDKIIINNDYKKNIIGRSIFTTTATSLMIMTLLGTFGYQALLKTPFPLLIAIKNISQVGGYSGLDALFLSFWIMADFITLSSFTYILLNLIKSFFNLNDYTSILSILMVFIFILSQFLAIDLFQLQTFSLSVTIPTNIATGLLLPIMIFFIGKVTRKL